MEHLGGGCARKYFCESTEDSEEMMRKGEYCRAEDDCYEKQIKVEIVVGALF